MDANSTFKKSLVINTPLPLDSDRFDVWKEIFETFIESKDFEMQDILNNGSFIPTFSFNDAVLNKPDFDWTKEDLRKVKIGFKVKHLFTSASSSKFIIMFLLVSLPRMYGTLLR